MRSHNNSFFLFKINSLAFQRWFSAQKHRLLALIEKAAKTEVQRTQIFLHPAFKWRLPSRVPIVAHSLRFHRFSLFRPHNAHIFSLCFTWNNSAMPETASKLEFCRKTITDKKNWPSETNNISLQWNDITAALIARFYLEHGDYTL